MNSPKEVKLHKEDVEKLFAVATQYTGNNYSQSQKESFLVTNFMRRLGILKTSPEAYFDLIKTDLKERNQFISSLTIHTTSWFREKNQLDHLMNLLKRHKQEFIGRNFHILSAACSTGEEVYTIGLLMESLRREFPNFNYKITGVDIDPLSVAFAARAIYNASDLAQIPAHHHQDVLMGSGPTKGYLTLSKEIRSRTQFFAGNLLGSITPKTDDKFELIFCRNVLIYFSQADVKTIIHKFQNMLTPNGYLCVGHSETFDFVTNLTREGNAIYQKKTLSVVTPAPSGLTPKQKSILVIDDSATIRKVLRRLFESHQFAVFDVDSGPKATQFLQSHSVDLISLDLHMPEQDGLEWYRKQQMNGLKTPVMIVSDSSPKEVPEVLQVLENGAEDYIEKKMIAQNPTYIINKVKDILHYGEAKSDGFDEKIYSVKPQSLHRADLIAIGASTGGTQALTQLLKKMPPQSPPILVVQHIGEAFLYPFAERLAHVAGLTLSKSEPGEHLVPGGIYLAHGDYHIGVKKIGAGKFILQMDKQDNGSGHRPSVDYLFHSIAAIDECTAAGVLLTGMGKDGAKGLKALHDRKMMTFAQDAKSSVVFGMPREAIKLGGAGFVGDLPQIREQLQKIIHFDSGVVLQRAQ